MIFALSDVYRLNGRAVYAWTVFARSNTGIMGSNPTWGIGISMRFFYGCAVLCTGSGLATGWSPVQEILPSVQKDHETEKAAEIQQRAVEP
jgi:hypothetical protein